jgi:hypothetical protein
LEVGITVCERGEKEKLAVMSSIPQIYFFELFELPPFHKQLRKKGSFSEVHLTNVHERRKHVCLSDVGFVYYAHFVVSG